MLQAKREYAVVVLCDDATTALYVAELGKQDPTRGYVTSQPYQVGVLLSSSNASTWTAHQDPRPDVPAFGGAVHRNRAGDRPGHR